MGGKEVMGRGGGELGDNRYCVMFYSPEQGEKFSVSRERCNVVSCVLV